jgi:mono/diheme cytochrome c family protein
MYAYAPFKTIRIIIIVVGLLVCAGSAQHRFSEVEMSTAVNRSTASQAIYSRNCAECHGSDGRARTAKGKRAGATDFTSDWNTDEARGIRIITNGKDEMPSFKKKLTAAEIRSVWNYVLRFKK